MHLSGFFSSFPHLFIPLPLPSSLFSSPPSFALYSCFPAFLSSLSPSLPHFLLSIIFSVPSSICPFLFLFFFLSSISLSLLSFCSSAFPDFFYLSISPSLLSSRLSFRSEATDQCRKFSSLQSDRVGLDGLRRLLRYHEAGIACTCLAAAWEEGWMTEARWEASETGVRSEWRKAIE